MHAQREFSKPNYSNLTLNPLVMASFSQPQMIEKRRFLHFNAIVMSISFLSVIYNFILHPFNGLYVNLLEKMKNFCYMKNYIFKWHQIIKKNHASINLQDFLSVLSAQLLSTYAFSADTFSLNVLSTLIAIYSQSIVNTNNFFSYFYQRTKYVENDIGFIKIKPIV